MCGAAQVQAQMVVTAPSLEVQEAMNHVEQMQQAVQTYQTMMGVKQGIEKTVDAVEKVNSKLATVREVQEIATRSAACVKRIQQVYAKISAMKAIRPTCCRCAARRRASASISRPMARRSLRAISCA